MGQGHDRIQGDSLIAGINSPVAMSGDDDDVRFDTTPRQKMISAMSGSLLTSLLGLSILKIITLLKSANKSNHSDSP